MNYSVLVICGVIVFCTFGYAYLKFGEDKKAANAVVKGLVLQPDDFDNEDNKKN